MRQAITTKFLGPTNVRGSRVKATAAAGSITLHWDYALNVDGNHTAAAKALVEKLGWTSATAKGYAGVWVGGGLPSEAGNVYVYTGEAPGLVEAFGAGDFPPGTAFEV